MWKGFIFGQRCYIMVRGWSSPSINLCWLPPPPRGRTTCVLMLFSVFTRQRSFRSRWYILLLTYALLAPSATNILNFYICYNILINWLRHWWVTIVTFDYIVKIKTNFKQETHIYQPTFSSGQSLSFLLVTWSWSLQSKPSDSGDENDQPTTGQYLTHAYSHIAR